MTPAARNRILIIGLIIAVSVPAGIIGVRSLLVHQIKSKIEQRILRLRDAGYIVTYDSIRVDWQQNSVQLYRLSVKNSIDSTFCRQQHLISARYISAEGMNIRTLLFKGHLDFEKIVLDSPRISINEKTFVRDSTKRRSKEFAIFVQTIKFPALQVEYYDSRSCIAGSGSVENASISDFKLAFYTDQPLFLDVDSFRADSITVNIPYEFYTLRIKAITFKPSMGILDLDTLKIIPHHSKLAFGRKKGFEIDRIEGTIPYINLSGLSVTRKDSLSIVAEKLTTQMFLRVFRDKRLPFKTRYKNLPIQALNSLPVGVDIKNLVLNKSYIEYEEYVDGADSSGRVFFDNLYATISDINNTDYGRKGRTVLVAHADFMGQAEVKVRATCPWNTRMSQRVTGTIRNLDMKNLNQVLEPIVQLRVESGLLKKLAFDFNSGPVHASGKVELDYNDLKLLSFKDGDRVQKLLKRKKRKHPDEEQDEEKVRKAAFKTFLINTFIIHKKMEDDHVDDQRSGTIDFDRDQARSVFNYWWKSVLTGVKSAYHLEKIHESKLSKFLKKKDKGAP
jgi:hypothetical protein